MKTANPGRAVVAANIRAELARRQISQQELADWLGIKQPAISAKLNAKAPFDTDELGIIAQQLHVPMSVLTQDPSFPFQGGSVGTAAPIAQLAELRTFNPLCAPSSAEMEEFLGAVEAWANCGAVRS